jgi:ABC-type multidrug transport system fused ATPase/permease subunit
VIGAAAALFILMRPLNTWGRREAAALSATQMDFAAGVNQAVALAEEVQVFGSVDAQQNRVSFLVGAARERFFRTQLSGRLVPGIYQGIVLLLLVGGLAAVHLWNTAHIADLGAIVLLLVRASSYGSQVQGSYQQFQQTLPFLDRLSETERHYQESRVHPGSRRLAAVRTIEMDEVSYSYRSGDSVLSSVSFTVEGGQAVAVVGPTGAGKSTLVQLLLRLRVPTSGAYLIDGEIASSYSPVDWHREIAYVPQEPRLLHATVADNIRFFRNLDDAAVERAAVLARVHDDIVGWTDGYQTVIGQRADAVSGGQRQRICLARALAADPHILVLDEPTSQLDLRSESLVQDSLAGLHGTTTLFVVAHRLSMLSVCDMALVLNEGRVEAYVHPDQLAANSAFYRGAIALGGDSRVTR